MAMTTMWILNDGENLSFDDETKSERLTKKLEPDAKVKRLKDDGMKLSDAEVTPVTPSYVHVVLPCSCDSSTLMRSFHAFAVLPWS